MMLRAGGLQVPATAPRTCVPLSAWNRQHGHDLDSIARENGKEWMLVEELGGGLVRISAHNRERAQAIAYIVDPSLRDLLGLPQWSAHADNGGVMLVDPCLPGRRAFSCLRTAIGFGES